jgi:kynureninase
MNLTECQQLDALDPLRTLKNQFTLPPGVIYLDGNSLGAMPKAAAARIANAVQQEWGTELIRAWNSAGWFEAPLRLGNRLAPWIGAGQNEVVVTDTTSTNLYKTLFAGILIAKKAYTDCGVSPRSTKNIVLSERSNFPTDLYIAQGLCAQHGFVLKLIEPEELPSALTEQVAVLMLTHVNYRTGAMHDMKAVTAAAHAAGALTVWDLAHSAGAVPVDLNGSKADFSIGCGYKYLNGGPGAPAFVWVNPRHAGRFWQPLAGWWGHEAPFQFTPDYRPAPGITRYLCGTQPILSMTALDCGLDTLLAAEPFGGMNALRTKSLALTDLFIELALQRCAGHGLGLATPREHAQRGSQVCLTREYTEQGSGAFAIVQALIARGVIGDFRAGDGKLHKDILRFGFTPLYIGFEDVWNAVEHLRQVLETGEWQRPEFNQKHAVT